MSKSVLLRKEHDGRYSVIVYRYGTPRTLSDDYYHVTGRNGHWRVWQELSRTLHVADTLEEARCWVELHSSREAQHTQIDRGDAGAVRTELARLDRRWNDLEKAIADLGPSARGTKELGALWTDLVTTVREWNELNSVAFASGFLAS